jgi:hypothetical protein
LNRSEAATWFNGKRVAIVGSGPGCLDNETGFVDSHDVVLRVNNFRLTPNTGFRTDVFYSFFGSSIRTSKDDLADCSLCMCKLPNADIVPFLTPQETEWHRRRGKMVGVDYRPHYRRRQEWWFCPTYVPTVEEFFVPFNELGRHQPTSGFAAIFDVLSFNPKSVFLTGFDFFRSKLHNVTEPWRPKNHDDPIGHRPEAEFSWLMKNLSRVTADKKLSAMISSASSR